MLFCHLDQSEEKIVATLLDCRRGVCNEMSINQKYFISIELAFWATFPLALKWWSKWALYFCRFDGSSWGRTLGSPGNSLHSLLPSLHYTVLPDSIIHEEGASLSFPPLAIPVLTRSFQLLQTVRYSSVRYCTVKRWK